MSKCVYLGNNDAASKVKNIYVGDSDNSKKVKKAYIGESNQSKLFFSSGYIWKKYNITYGETAGAITTTPGVLIYGVYKLYIFYLPTLSINNGRYSFTTFSITHDFSTGNSDEIRCYLNENYGCAISTSPTYVWKCVTGGGGVELNYWAENRTRVGTGLQNWSGYRGSLQQYTITENRGTYIADVESDNVSAYPTNGRHTDGYWYVLQSQ